MTYYVVFFNKLNSFTPVVCGALSDYSGIQTSLQPFYEKILHLGASDIWQCHFCFFLTVTKQLNAVIRDFVCTVSVPVYTDSTVPRLFCQMQFPYCHWLKGQGRLKYWLDRYTDTRIIGKVVSRRFVSLCRWSCCCSCFCITSIWCWNSKPGKFTSINQINFHLSPTLFDICGK